MALFRDGPLISIKVLQEYENGILSVASTENIDLVGKIELAQRQIANDLEIFLLRRQAFRDFAWMLRPKANISDVVVTGPLRQWHAHKALALVYRDAYNNQLNDRYQGKWTEYEQLANKSSRDYFEIGVGVVTDPIRKASIPLLSTVPGNGSAGTYYVAITWLNVAGEESSPSDVAQSTTVAGQQLVVTAAWPPSNAVGWNAYVGLSPETIGLQNSAPVGINTSWTLTATPQQGARPGEGQRPICFLVDRRTMQRG